MRAAVFHQTGQPLTIETVADPVPRPDEVILEVSSCGICGSDLHATEHPGLLPAGAILGHEFAGTIVDGNASGLTNGTIATAMPVVPCWECAECHTGEYAHCSSVQFIGIGRVNGGFARYVSVPSRMIRTLPVGIRLTEGALIEPLAVAHHAVAMAGSLAGKSVLVIGAGQVGAAVTLFAAAGGAAHVIVSEPAAGRREQALALGATAVIDPAAQEVGTRLHALTGGGADIVFECVGIPGMIAHATDLVRNRGLVVVVGVCMQPDRFMPTTAQAKEAVIRFSLAYTMSDFDKVIDSFAHELIKPAPLITSRIGLDAMPAMFESLRKPSDQCLVLVDFD